MQNIVLVPCHEGTCGASHAMQIQNADSLLPYTNSLLAEDYNQLAWLVGAEPRVNLIPESWEKFRARFLQTSPDETFWTPHALGDQVELFLTTPLRTPEDLIPEDQLPQDSDED